MALQPVVKRSVSGDVFEQIVADVLSGELAPGATLPSERQLAEALGVSRPAVREALQRLAAAGLVSVRQGDATTVLDYRRGAGLEVLPRLLVQAGELDPAVARSILEARLHNGPKVAELAAARAAASGASPTLAEPTASDSTAATDTTAAPVGPSASDTPTALGEPTASNSTTTTDTTAAPVGPSASDTPTALGEPTASDSTAATDAATLSTAADGTSPAHTEPGVDGAAAAIDTSASPTEPAPSNDTSAPLTESTGTADTTAPTVRATSAPPTEGTTTYRTTAAPVGPAARAASITSASTAPTGSTTQHAPTTGTSPARRTARPTTSDGAPSTPFDALVASVEVLAGEEDPVARQRVALDFWDHVVDAADSIVFRLMFNMLRAAYEPALAALAPIMSAEVGNVGAYRELADAITAGRPQEAADIARALLEPATTALIEVLGGH